MSEIVTKLLMNATAIQLLKGIGQRGNNRLNKCSLILKEKKKGNTQFLKKSTTVLILFLLWLR